MGTYYHGFMDVALCGPLGVAPEDIRFEAYVGPSREELTPVDVSYSSERVQAERVFRDWATQYAKSWAGIFTPLACEVEFPINEGQASTIKQLTGGIPRSLTLDAILYAYRDGEIWIDDHLVQIEQGLYVMDTKTHTARGLTLIDSYDHSNQLSWYGGACEALYPEAPWKGILVNQVITTKTPKFGLHLRSMPSEQELQRAIRMMWMAEYFRADPYLHNWANTTECVQLWGVCHHSHLAGGVCEGI